MTRPLSRRPWRLLVLVAVLAAACTPTRGASQAADRTFAGLVERLSEPGGYFDTDNLISNELSYLQALDPLRRHGVRGGAYIGVGPEQNFSYIAEIGPEIAYLVDIRRDNLLLHLVFKALFEEAGTRLEYLALLFGRAPPDTQVVPTEAGAEAVLAAVDALVSGRAHADRARQLVDRRIAGFGVPLSDQDRGTIDRFHRAFIAAGPELRFTSHGRGPRSFYPTYRELAQATDRAGRPGSFLASEQRYAVVRRLQREDRIIPVVGDLAGPHALEAIGRDIGSRGLAVSALYVSNVEFYLWGDGTFDRFARTAAELPRTPGSVIIRSWFGRGRPHPSGVGGQLSTQLVQTLDAFAALHSAGIPSYWDLVTRDYLPPE